MLNCFAGSKEQSSLLLHVPTFRHWDASDLGAMIQGPIGRPKHFLRVIQKGRRWLEAANKNTKFKSTQTPAD